jgi:hypothetical protein
MLRAFIFGFSFDPLVSILSVNCQGIEREPEYDAEKREYLVKSFAELCQMSNEMVRLLYKKSAKYDTLVISASLAMFALIVLVFVQTK